jgi:hypothetical protein
MGIGTAPRTVRPQQPWIDVETASNMLERMVSGRTNAHELERLLPWTWKMARPIDT